MPTEPTEPTESTEPSEHDARDLLARAAATIDVDEVAPLTLTGLPEPDGRRWPLLVAVAAAVVLVLGGGWWVATQVGTHGGTAAPADADGSPAETARVYDAGQMPSLLGYTEGEARTLLEDAGVDVRVRAERDGCNVAGTVVGADTPVGDRLRPGTTVTMFVVKPRKVTDCVGEPDWATIWDLVRFARGLGGPPVLAPEVELSLERPDLDPVAGATRTRDELADPDGWTICGADGMCHSPLAGLEQMLTDPAIWAYAGTPTLSVSQGPGCLVGHHGGWFSYDWTYHLSVEVPVDGISCPATSLLVGTDDQGRIDAVELRLPPQGADVSEPQLETTLSRLSAAAQLARWARGHGSAPHFADRCVTSPGARRRRGSTTPPAWRAGPARTAPSGSSRSPRTRSWCRVRAARPVLTAVRYPATTQGRPTTW